MQRNCSCEGITAWLGRHWPQIKASIFDGSYRPRPVRRHEIPKRSGGTRGLGIPTIMDRMIQQAILQVVQPSADPDFSESSYGFSPGRSAHQAVRRVGRSVTRLYGALTG
ncbi:MAG: reverse transcriptase domain-containing protein [Gracilimonas sp.]